MPGVVDFSQAKSYAPVSGVYDATFIGAEYVAHSKSSGKPAVTFKFTLMDPKVEGRAVKTTKSLSPEGMWSTKLVLVAIGASPESVEGNIPDIEAFCGEFSGNTVRLGLSVGSYTDANTGETRATQQIDTVKGEYSL